MNIKTAFGLLAAASLALSSALLAAGEKAQTADAPPVAAGPPASEGEKPSILAEALGTATAAFQPTIGPRGGRYDSMATSMVKSAMRAASSSIGRQIARGILGGILGGGGRRR